MSDKNPKKDEIEEKFDRLREDTKNPLTKEKIEELKEKVLKEVDEKLRK